MRLKYITQYKIIPLTIHSLTISSSFKKQHTSPQYAINITRRTYTKKMFISGRKEIIKIKEHYATSIQKKQHTIFTLTRMRSVRHLVKQPNISAKTLRRRNNTRVRFLYNFLNTSYFAALLRTSATFLLSPSLFYLTTGI